MLNDWIGRSREITDEMTAPAARRLSAMLNQEPPPLYRGAEVPAHWLAILFDDAQPQSKLGADGHPAKGDFLPPVALPRRMLAGRRITYAAPLRVGEGLLRRSEIAAITPKIGRSGQLVFVTIRHTVLGDDGVVAVEEQDIAYREAGSAEAAPAETPALPAAAWREDFAPDPVLLFRYSALTFNGHRIHYDADYARGEEGYTGLVVNGGLTTMMLLDAALRHAGAGATLASAEIRTLRPLFCGGVATLAGAAPDAEGSQLLWAEDTGRMALRIQARFA